jgi:hypothetical protein
MNQLKLMEFSVSYARLEGCEITADSLRTFQGSGASVAEEQMNWLRKVLKELRDACYDAKLMESSQKIYSSEHHLSGANAKTNVDVVWTHIRTVREQIIRELAGRKFLYVDPQFSKCVDQDDLFGESVKKAFPSATYDIKESGNCLAADCATAAVFHLMRVAEYGLRALAWDRRIKVPKGPIELACWEDIIRELEDAEKAIKNFPKTWLGKNSISFTTGP